MLQINNITNKIKSFRIPLLFFAISIGGVFLFQYLTFIPEYSTAAPISTDTPVKITPTTPLAKWDNLEYMQQMTPEACSSVSIGTSKPLKDSRDTDTSYTIKKLSDNKCWMVDNLRITNKNISSADSDLSEGTSYTIPVSNLWTDKTTTANGAYYENNTAHGAYYTWYTATAGTGKSSVTSGQASGSICPKGWRLPTGGSSGEFKALYNNGYSSWTTDNNINGRWFGGTSSSAVGAAFFTASGIVPSGSLINVGSDGYYWSSTPYGSSYPSGTYNFGFDSSNIYPADYHYLARYNGYSVRCVAKTTSDVTPVDPSAGGNTGINDPNVSVTVPNIITLDVSNNIDIATEPNKVNTGTFTTTVESNQDYSISLNAANDSTSLINSKDGNKIAEIPTTTTNTQPAAGTSSWGIRICNSLLESSCDSALYQPLPAKNQTNTFTTGTKGTHQHLFQIGIGIGPELPSGTYTTSIQVTASQK